MSVKLRSWWRAAISVTLITGMYFIVPLHQRQLYGVEVIIRVAALLAGLGLLTYVVVRQIEHASQRNRLLAEQIATLLTLVNLVIVFFALAYYKVSDQFTGIESRLDALYFAVTTLSTVGYGDVTATGQTARAIVTLQMVFDLIIVTSAITIIVAAPKNHADDGSRDRAVPHQDDS